MRPAILTAACIIMAIATVIILAAAAFEWP